MMQWDEPRSGPGRQAAGPGSRLPERLVLLEMRNRLAAQGDSPLLRPEDSRRRCLESTRLEISPRHVHRHRSSQEGSIP